MATNGLLRNDIEYIVHCDSEGDIIGPISKKHAHLPGVRPVLTHYSTWSMIYNPTTGMYGIQLKNPKKDDKQSAGKWDMGVAGHNCYVRSGSSFRPLDFEETLAKEASEEIGIDVKMFKSQEPFLQAAKKLRKGAIGYIFERFNYKTPENNEWVGLGLILTTSEKVEFTDEEVVEFRWLRPNQLKKFLEKNRNYCAPLPLVFEKVETFRNKHLNMRSVVQ